MRIDLYTKVVLTAIAGFLGLIALRPFVGPEVVQAQGAFSGVQIGIDGNVNFFDSRTGEFWAYEHGTAKPSSKYRLTKLGQPMIKEK